LIEYLKLVKDDNQAIKVPLQDGTSINILPSENLTIPVNVDEIKKAGFVPKDVEPLLTNQMNWSIGTSGILKPQLVQLDIIAQNAANGWKRPIYFASSLSKVSYLNMKEFMQLEGYAYRLMPVKIEGATEGIVNTAVLERNLMKKMVWKNLDNPQVYHHSEFYQLPTTMGRLSFQRLASQFAHEGKYQKAKDTLDYCKRIMPDQSIPYDHVSAGFVSLYLTIGDHASAMEIANTMMNRNNQLLDFYGKNRRASNEQDIQIALFQMQIIVESLKNAKAPEAEKYEQMFQQQLQKLSS
jgi:hypothetical protein